MWQQESRRCGSGSARGIRPGTQQIALSLRIVCGLTVQDVARTFLVTYAAMEQRTTRAKSRVAAAEIRFETPGERTLRASDSFRPNPELLGLLALMLLQHACSAARLDFDRAIVLLEESGSPALGPRQYRRGAGASRQGDSPRSPGTVPGTGRDRGAARSRPPIRRRAGTRSSSSTRRSNGSSRPPSFRSTGLSPWPHCGARRRG